MHYEIREGSLTAYLASPRIKFTLLRAWLPGCLVLGTSDHEPKYVSSHDWVPWTVLWTV